MLQTSEFIVSKREYFKIYLLYRLRRIWIFFLIYAALSFFNYYNFQDNTSLITAVMVLTVYLLLIALQSYLFSYSNKNKTLFLPKHIKIENGKLVSTTLQKTVFDTQLTNEVLLETITKKRELQNFLLFFIGRGQFFVVPKAAFQNQNAEQEFINLIKQGGGLK